MFQLFQHDDQKEVIPESTLLGWVSTYTDRGPKYRAADKPNEDLVATGTWMTNEGETYAVDLICDGLGGYEDGQMASLIAGQQLQQWVQNLHREAITDPQELIQNWISSTVQAYKSKSLDLKSGTTFVLAFWTPSELMIAHLGDSRAQLWDMEETKLLWESNDHKPDDFEQRFKLSAYLHQDDPGNLYSQVHFQTWSRDELPDETLLLLASDGFTDNMIPAADDRNCAAIIAEELAQDVTLEELTENLIIRAFERMELHGTDTDLDPKPDNISLLIRNL